MNGYGNKRKQATRLGYRTLNSAARIKYYSTLQQRLAKISKTLKKIQKYLLAKKLAQTRAQGLLKHILLPKCYSEYYFKIFIPQTLGLQKYKIPHLGPASNSYPGLPFDNITLIKIVL